MEEHFSKLQELYLSAKINSRLFPTSTIEIRAKEATISLEVSDNYHHGFNAMHGAIYFKLLDDAAYFAVNSVVQDQLVVTSTFNTQLLRPHKTGKLIATGTLTFASRSLFYAESEIKNTEGKIIAKGQGQFMKSGIKF